MDFEGRGRILEPQGRHFGLGDIFGPILGSRTTYFCEGMISWCGLRGFCLTQINCMVRGTHLGVLVCPKTSLFTCFIGLFTFPEKLQVDPVASLLSLVGPLAAYFYLVATLRCQKGSPIGEPKQHPCDPRSMFKDLRCSFEPLPYIDDKQTVATRQRSRKATEAK